MRGSEQVYFDAAVTLLFFLLVGRFLDQRMRARAAGAAANLIGLRGDDAPPSSSRTASPCASAPRRLQPGMRILTAAGERFAVDGRVLEGHGEVDESLITGETAPRRLRPAPSSMPAPSTCPAHWSWRQRPPTTTHCWPKSPG